MGSKSSEGVERKTWASLKGDMGAGDKRESHKESELGRRRLTPASEEACGGGMRHLTMRGTGSRAPPGGLGNHSK